MERISVRELRQHTSRYLARVRSGECIDVTDRGQIVARLVPAEADQWNALVASGRVIVPTETGDVADVLPPDFGIQASAVLAALRDDR